MSMRDLKAIEADNGPARTVRQAVRIAKADCQVRHPDHYREQQLAHGRRVEARQRINGRA